MAIAPVTSAGSETSFMVCQFYWTHTITERWRCHRVRNRNQYLLVHYL